MVSALASGGVMELLAYAFESRATMDFASATSTLHAIARCKKIRVCDISNDPGFHALRVRLDAIVQQDFAQLLPIDEYWNGATQCLSSLAWSYATLQLDDVQGQKTMRLIYMHVSYRMDAFQPSELSEVLWAFAKFPAVDATLLFDVFAQKSAYHLHTFSPTALSTIAWSFGTLFRGEHALLLESLFNAYSEKINAQHMFTKTMTTEIASLLWGAAKSGARREFLDVMPVMNAASQLLHAFKPHELAISCWSISCLGIIDEYFFEGVCNFLHSSECYDMHFKVEGITKLLWSLARQVELGSGVTQLLKCTPPFLASELVRLFHVVQIPDLESLLRSLVQLGVRSGSDATLDDFFIQATHIDLENCTEDMLAAFSVFCTGFDTQSALICNEFQKRAAMWYSNPPENTHSPTTYSFPLSKQSLYVEPSFQQMGRTSFDCNPSSTQSLCGEPSFQEMGHTSFDCNPSLSFPHADDDYRRPSHTLSAARQQWKDPLCEWNMNGVNKPVEQITIHDFLSRMPEPEDITHPRADLSKMAAPRVVRRWRDVKHAGNALNKSSDKVATDRKKDYNSDDVGLKASGHPRAQTVSFQSETTHDGDTFMNERSSESSCSLCGPEGYSNLASALSSFPKPAEDKNSLITTTLD
eukprot:TRINITY_DN9643_c0_g1_i1.p1 TRINITY_DN9643_c0_g1~~TRINITY_DN9643_c0_g1_i1.p1  ORF type:complete len:641 (+),score=95.96 TRINITY_DN9643_c0_g1_i1:81-2003(+)